MATREPEAVVGGGGGAVASAGGVRPVPEDVSLEAAIRCMPSDVMTIRPVRAFLAWVQAFAQTLFSLWLLHRTPDVWWALLPAWFFAGTCAQGLFVIGHECGHGCYSRNDVVNEIFGTAALAPLGWPFNSWRFTHNNHHAHTNNLDRDHVWKPLAPETVVWMNSLVAPIGFALKRAAYYFYCGPLFFEASIVHHLVHFNVFAFRPKHRLTVLRSVLITIVACAAIFQALYAAGGYWLWFKMWLMPYLGFNFWLSTYTYFHHKAPDIAWKRSNEWNKAEAQLFGTVHVDYHPIIEFLHFDINWHIPHHVTVRIPWYNLRRATYALMSKYGDALHSYEMGVELWTSTTSHCHVHDEQEAYKPIWNEEFDYPAKIKGS